MKNKKKKLNENGKNLYDLFYCSEMKSLIHKEKVLNNELTESDIGLYIHNLIWDVILLIKYSNNMGVSLDNNALTLDFKMALVYLIDNAKTDKERKDIIDSIDISLHYDEKMNELKERLRRNNEKLKEYLDKKKEEEN